MNHKISHPVQVGGIETAVLDNGPGRGSRVAWINTGSGLHYKVLIDRGMDLAEAFFNGKGLAWISHGGTKVPPASYQSGFDWLRHWGGGLVTTCGLDHMGSPENDLYGDRGLHGQIGYQQAEIVSVLQPDPAAGSMDFSLTGKMRQSKVFGLRLELLRTVSGTLGQPFIRIHDVVTNRGNTPAPHMMLYHINLGWPLVEAGAEIFWEGEWDSRGGEQDDAIFHEGGTFKVCQPPLETHIGTGESCAFIDPSAGSDGWCRCGINNPQLGMKLEIQFRKEQLPWLINWQHWGPGEYVTGLEPATNPTVGQTPARESGTLRFLESGESLEYDLVISVSQS